MLLSWVRFIKKKTVCQKEYLKIIFACTQCWVCNNIYTTPFVLQNLKTQFSYLFKTKIHAVTQLKRKFIHYTIMLRSIYEDHTVVLLSNRPCAYIDESSIQFIIVKKYNLFIKQYGKLFVSKTRNYGDSMGVSAENLIRYNMRTIHTKEELLLREEFMIFFLLGMLMDIAFVYQFWKAYTQHFRNDIRIRICCVLDVQNILSRSTAFSMSYTIEV